MATEFDEHLQSLNNQGFTVISEVLREDQLAVLKNLAEEIIRYADKNLIDPFQQYYMRHRADQGALYDLFQRHPEFQDVAKCSAVLDVLENCLGKDIFLYENSLVYKPKNRDNAVPWHQDFINRPDEPHKYVAWFALDDVTIANGAMRVIPGSHRNGFLPWYHVKGETHHTRLKPEFIDESSAVHVELAAGSVLIFDQLLVHGSHRIDSNAPRRAYRVSYQGFEQIYTPRGTPIVLRGGLPQSLADKYPQKYEEPITAEPNLFGRIANATNRVASWFIRQNTEQVKH